MSTIWRYSELNPDQLEQRIGQAPVAILPIGALEWHGHHLPLGLDGIVAEWFAERLAERSEAVLLPCLWAPITTLPHPHSIDYPTELVVSLLARTLGRLEEVGFKAVLLVTGHYAQGHVISLYRLARDLSKQSFMVFPASPLEVLHDESMLDHAGKWETAQLQLIRPDLVHLDGFSGSPAVLGEDPRLSGSIDVQAALDQALDEWHTWTRLLLRGDLQRLNTWLDDREHRYDTYVARYYRGSWEDAIRQWWSERAD